MTKERLTLEGIKKDLSKAASDQMFNKDEWRLSYIIPITMLAIMLGILLNSMLVGLLVFSLTGYQIYRYVIETREYNKQKKALSEDLERGDISISTEIFSHVAEEIVYEPCSRGYGKHRRHHLTKSVTVFYFEGGASWRVIKTCKHYEWSREHYISTSGLKNIAVAGNEFFAVRLQKHPEVSYIYPCKLFELDESLEK